MILRNADYTWKERVFKLCLIEITIAEGVGTRRRKGNNMERLTSQGKAKGPPGRTLPSWSSSFKWTRAAPYMLGSFTIL